MSITQERKTQCSACGTTESEKILKRVITLDYNAYDGEYVLKTKGGGI